MGVTVKAGPLPRPPFGRAWIIYTGDSAPCDGHWHASRGSPELSLPPPPYQAVKEQQVSRPHSTGCSASLLIGPLRSKLSWRGREERARGFAESLGGCGSEGWVRGSEASFVWMGLGTKAEELPCRWPTKFVPRCSQFASKSVGKGKILYRILEYISWGMLIKVIVLYNALWKMLATVGLFLQLYCA